MLNPSDMVGQDFLVTTQTDHGPFQRLVRAFDETDAIDQMLAYLQSEGIPHGSMSTQPF